MKRCCSLCFCVILMTRLILCEGCQIQLTGNVYLLHVQNRYLKQYKSTKKSNVKCDTCVEDQQSTEVCSQATGRIHRFYNFSVVSSNVQVLSSEFVNNRTLIKLNISREYSQYTGGYLFIFLMDDDESLLCKSAIFPRCTASLASLTLSVSGRSSTDPEIHQLLDTHAVSEEWISEVMISRSNSSYLKISFDVKNRDVKWYAVELWDSKNNLIKTEKTEKNYIVFMNVTPGIYYTKISILEMMKGSQCPCSINVPGHKQCVTCTAKKSDLFTYPTKEEAIARQKSNREVLLVSLICGGFAAVVGTVIGVVLMKKKIKKLMHWVRTGSYRSVSLTIVTTIHCPDTVNTLRKIIRTKFNIVSKHLSLSPKDIAQVYNFASDIFIVVISKQDLTNHSIPCYDLFHEYKQISEGKTVVFAVMEDVSNKSISENSYPTSVPRYLMFNITNNLDFLLEFLAMKIALQKYNFNQESLQREHEETIFRPYTVESYNQSGLREENEKELDQKYSNIIMSQGNESTSNALDTIGYSRGHPDTHQIKAGNQESEGLESFSFRSYFIPPDEDSDSAYKTQSECMKTINDAYDVYRREENTFFSSSDIEAISLGERSV